MRIPIDPAAGLANFAKVFDILSAQKLTIIGILMLLIMYVTMVYGPIAAALVELFPTRIRYSGLSLPYHIGNGWFGGLLPATSFAMVAQTGDIYFGPLVSGHHRRGDGGHRPAVVPETHRTIDEYTERSGMTAPRFDRSRASRCGTTGEGERALCPPKPAPSVTCVSYRKCELMPGTTRSPIFACWFEGGSFFVGRPECR